MPGIGTEATQTASSTEPPTSQCSQPSTSALARFKDKCVFDPSTGCVLWNGALTNGKGSSSIYGRFWYEGKSWYAHLWAAKFIHGIEVGEGEQVDHCCEVNGERQPNSLCVQHLQPLPALVNARLRWSRFWEYWSGEEEEAELEGNGAKPIDPGGGVPFYSEPDWLRDADGNEEETDDANCPF